MSAMERSSLSPAHLRLCRENYDRRQSQLLNGLSPDPSLPAHYVQYLDDLDPSKDVLEEEVTEVEEVGSVQEVAKAEDAENVQEAAKVEAADHSDSSEHSEGRLKHYTGTRYLAWPNVDHPRNLPAPPQNHDEKPQPDDAGYDADVGEEDTTRDGQFASSTNNAEPVSPLSTDDSEISLIMAIRTDSNGTIIRRNSTDRLALDQELGREGADKLINRTVRRFNRKHGTVFTRGDIALDRPVSPAEDADREPEEWNCAYLRRTPVPGPSFPNTQKRKNFKSHRHHRTSVLSPAILSGLGAYIPGPESSDRDGIPMAQPVKRRFTLDDSEDERGKGGLRALLPVGKVTKIKEKLRRRG